MFELKKDYFRNTEKSRFFIEGEDGYEFNIVAFREITSAALIKDLDINLDLFKVGRLTILEWFYNGELTATSFVLFATDRPTERHKIIQGRINKDGYELSTIWSHDLHEMGLKIIES